MCNFLCCLSSFCFGFIIVKVGAKYSTKTSICKYRTFRFVINTLDNEENLQRCFVIIFPWHILGIDFASILWPAGKWKWKTWCEIKNMWRVFKFLTGEIWTVEYIVCLTHEYYMCGEDLWRIFSLVLCFLLERDQQLKLTVWLCTSIKKRES